MEASATRTRWAAIGAAVAVALGAGGIGLVSATSPAGAVTYLPLDEPCRAADTRPDPQFNIGPRTTPLGADDTHTINANDGDCAGKVAAAATSVLLNITAVDATAATFLTIWANGPRPDASSLNPAPGQPPVPNAVTTAITGANNLEIFNRFGTVHVIVDVIGYFIDHHHDDRYYTKDEIDALPGRVEHINISNGASVRTSLTSTGLQPSTVFRPAGQPVGHYCVNVPNGRYDIFGTVGAIQSAASSGTGGADNIRLTTTFSGTCQSAGAEIDVRISTDSGALSNGYFTLLIPLSS